MKRTVILAILDGWGIGREDESNPIHVVRPKNIEYIKKNYLAGALQSSGIAVGLPWEEEGNSEVGHLTIGAGKVIYQHFPRITLAIRDGSFFKNGTLLKAAEHVKNNGSALHLIGLLSRGNVHSSFEHLEALIAFAAKENLPRVKLHLFTDGKDSPPKSAAELIENLKKIILKSGNIALSSIGGRYYGMDRDQHWDRTADAYEAIVGKRRPAAGGPKTPEEHILNSYRKNLSDEFIEPFSFDEQTPMRDGDAIIFFNFREDSMRQVVETFINPEFDKFQALPLQNLFIATMTQYYEKKFHLPVAFPPEQITNPLGRVLAENGKQQLRIAETEKYAHITYFFNGFRDAPFQNEYRILVPSKNVPRHDEHPEMMAQEVTGRAIESINEKGFDFILINYANPDIIAHTGNYDACLKAVQTVDDVIGQLMKAALEQNCALILTSDHGNMERVMDPLTAVPETKHDPNPVPVYVVAQEFKRVKNEAAVRMSEKEVSGILADVAPTILALMNIPKPVEMTGQNLLPLLY